MSSTKMTLQQEIDAAIAIVRVGLDRLRDAATRTEDIAPHTAVLRALYDQQAPEAGVLAAVGDVIGTIAVSITEVDDDRIDRVVELLDEAQAYSQDSTGERVYRALELMAPLLPRCGGCGEQKPDVKAMKDPFTTALYPETDDHETVHLCPPCATARFEES
ncbi:hypothetical protein [Streptomyces sp. NPDC056491]|uniref:hypothetical protein n=1 Tax=Streptomyces sp. NPDC056491 TaxID=3345837 RepID=UPI0036AEED15